MLSSANMNLSFKISHLKSNDFKTIIRNYFYCNQFNNFNCKKRNFLSATKVKLLRSLTVTTDNFCKNKLLNRKIFEKNNFFKSKLQVNVPLSVNASEIEWIHKLYPQPKLILHNFYQILCSEFDSEDYKPVVGYKSVITNKKSQIQWDCVIKLNWPIEIKFNAISNTKQDASKKAALKALHWLKLQQKITSNGIPCISGKNAINNKITPFEFDVDSVSTENLGTIINTYQNCVLPALENIKTDVTNNSDYIKTNDEEMFGSVNRELEKVKSSLRRFKWKAHSNFPILKYRDTIIHSINENQVVIIKGEPGCGKSTQVPQYILEHWIDQKEIQDCQVIVTQPRRIAAISLAQHVSRERKEQLGKTIGYQVRLERAYNPKTGVILYCTTGILLKRLQYDPSLLNVSHVILDEAHERDANTDMLMVLLRRAISSNSQLKLIIMSATIDTTLFQNYYTNGFVLHIPGFTYPVKRYFLEDIKFDFKKHKGINFSSNPNIDAEEIAKFIEWLHCNKKEGAILCFLPGWDEINKVKQYLEIIMKDYDNVIFPLHSRLSNLMQRKIFAKPPNGIRKIILTTNIAETSVTIDDVVYVVDSGVHKEKRFHADKGIESLDCHWISQSSVNQRAGRAGRVQPGESYHLFTKEKFQNMNRHSLPEIIRVSLLKIILDSKVYSHDIKAAQFFKELPTPPDSKTINQAITELIALNMLDAEEQLTPLGKIVSLFSLSPKLSKVLIYSYFFRCVDPILDIITVLSSDIDIFSNSLLDKVSVREIKKGMSKSSDHLAFAKIMTTWREKLYDDIETAKKWCYNHNINHEKMILLEKLRKIHYQYLNDLDQKVKMNISHKYSSNKNLIKGVLLSGFGNILHFRNWDIIKGRLKNKNVFVAKNGHKAILTSDSVNYKCKKFETPFFVYAYDIHSLIRRIILIRETSTVSPLVILLFMNQCLDTFHIGKDEQHAVVTLGKNIKVSCSKETLEKLQKVASILDVMVNYFIKYGSDERYSHITKSIVIAWDDILNELNSLLLTENIFTELVTN